MPSYNRQFDLDLHDMELIETALRKVAHDDSASGVEPAQVHDLLGRLHHQKVFYRPKSGIYVSG